MDHRIGERGDDQVLDEEALVRLEIKAERHALLNRQARREGGFQHAAHQHIEHVEPGKQQAGKNAPA